MSENNKYEETIEAHYRKNRLEQSGHELNEWSIWFSKSRKYAIATANYILPTRVNGLLKTRSIRGCSLYKIEDDGEISEVSYRQYPEWPDICVNDNGDVALVHDNLYGSEFVFEELGNPNHVRAYLWGACSSVEFEDLRTISLKFNFLNARCTITPELQINLAIDEINLRQEFDPHRCYCNPLVHVAYIEDIAARQRYIDHLVAIGEKARTMLGEHPQNAMLLYCRDYINEGLEILQSGKKFPLVDGNSILLPKLAKKMAKYL